MNSNLFYGLYILDDDGIYFFTHNLEWISTLITGFQM